MEKMGEEAAAKFINALIKSVQTLCHGYLDFQTGIEIIGHINLSVDKENSLDYILKEKVCKNAENSTLFISHSFHAEPKSEQEVPVKNAQAGNQNVQSRQPTDSGESGRVSSALSSISSALSGSRERSRQSNTKDSGSPHSYQSTAKRKASDDSGSEVRPSKVSSHHDSISHTSSDSAFPPTSSSPVDSKQSLRHLRTSDDNMSQTMLPQTANFTSDNAADIGVNLAGSVLEPVDDQSNPDLPERDDESDGDLEVTFIKEEYMEGERSACEFENSGQQFVGGPHRRASEGMPDPSLYPVALHGSSASATYVPSAHDQQFQPGSLGPSTSQPQPGPSGMRGSSWNDFNQHSSELYQRHQTRLSSVNKQQQLSSTFTRPQTGSGWTHDDPGQDVSTSSDMPQNFGKTHLLQTTVPRVPLSSVDVPRMFGETQPPQNPTTPQATQNITIKRETMHTFQTGISPGTLQPSSGATVEKTTAQSKILLCEYCDASFTSAGGLYLHKSSVHFKREFVCQVCGKVLKRKENLMKHMKLHNGPNTEKCPYCDAWFSAKYLPVHIHDQHKL
ncbi:uncharacterized protein [Littorina saxatilis]|uniref:uncharacterized protein isoform X5 n=1 Tax=Littorina saxatilis TaxID=31220 RepID=UPI0038B5B50A